MIRRIKLAARALLYGEAPMPGRRDIPAITAEEVAEAKDFFPLEKFFIFGHARSGTTLLTRLIRTHPQVHCNYQAHFFTRKPLLEALVSRADVGMWLGRRSNRWNRGRDLSPVVLRAASDFIMERDARRVGKASPGCIVGDKSPNSLLNGEAVHLMVKIYPDARLIFIVRDGRDAVVSHRFQAFIDRPHHLSKAGQRLRDEFARNPVPFQNGQRSLFTPQELRQAAAGWVQNVVETDRAARALLGESYLALRYEDLLAQPWQTMRRVWGFLGVNLAMDDLEKNLQHELGQNPDADWQQEKAAEIANALSKGQRGTWRELFTPQDRQIFKEVAGEALITWRYEQDLEW